MRRLIPIVAIVLAFPSVAMAHGGWYSLRQAKSEVATHYSIYECNYGWSSERGRYRIGCELVPGGLYRVSQLRAKVVGVGTSRVTRGVRRWQHFRVTGCGYSYTLDEPVRVNYLMHADRNGPYVVTPRAELERGFALCE
jgi:hypothetical protein